MFRMVKIGQPAPDFNAVTAYRDGEFTKVSLSDFQGKWVVLFFYPRDFTFVCPTEIREFAKLQDDFAKCDCQILGASTDSEYSHKAWFSSDLPEVAYPVLADTTQVLSRDFNVLGEDGASPPQAAIFAINMLVATPGGSSYRESEYRAWLREAGFEDVWLIELEGPSDLLIGRKP